jgi:hypothetical protein
MAGEVLRVNIFAKFEALCFVSSFGGGNPPLRKAANRCQQAF